LSGKTIIINVIDSGNVQLTGIMDMEDYSGNRGYAFDPNLTKNILWNFPSATSVTLDGTAEFQGSLLIPNGNLVFKHPGHSGRVIVNGDVTQNYGGSEFHNYPFDPTCSLPLPQCPTPRSVPIPGPVATPTEAPVTPTVAPVTPTVAPVTPTVAPVTPTVAPVTPTVAPVTPTVAPVTPTVAPVTPTSAPVTPTVAPVTPTEAPATPEICGMVMGETGDTICPGNTDVVKLIGAVGVSPPEDQDIIYNLEFLGGTEISFKINNPFESNTDVYVQYKESVGSGPAMNSKCAEDLDVPGCNPDNASTITAGCHAPPGTAAFAIVSIYFVSNDSYLGSGGATVDQCCHEDPDTIATPVVEYTFEIHCECPGTSNVSRNLRG
jgi:hypothetical protein